MKSSKAFPTTLMEAVTKFSNEDKAFEFAVNLRWPGGVICPMCGCKEHSFLSTRKTWQCKGCNKQFSVKKGSIFEDSPIKLGKWLIAMWLIANAKNGISSYELHRSIGVTQKTAWFMLHRIRLAMQSGSMELLKGTVEADETYIGGKSKNMHAWRREACRLYGQRFSNKTAVFGMMERGGRVEAKIIENNDRKTLGRVITSRVDGYAKLFTDAHTGYDNMKFYYEHHIIQHAREYVRGNVHTNGIENFWSLLKRTINGTYVSVEPIHLSRYLAEQVFRFNNRKINDAGRFITAMTQISGKRLTYSELTGKVA
ncbi:MAG: IS1595 family transposase [Fimbriimonadaceae bacterium]|nr:IS1595 family transposase [Fimbriimonadaceae bacterium]